MPFPHDLAARVAQRHLHDRTAGTRDIMDMVLPARDVMKLMSEMRKEGDEQSAELAYEVYSTISERLNLSDNEASALGRLKGSVDATGRWDAALQRNNIFKAANLLGIKLPSSMF